MFYINQYGLPISIAQCLFYEGPAGGRNAFAVGLRKRDDHLLRFRLGPDFNLNESSLPESIRQAMQHKPGAKWWSVPITTAPLAAYEPLLAAAYDFVTGSS